jgi:hypothetical protein
MDVKIFADEVKVPFSMAVASMRNSGKSVLIDQFIKHMKDTKKVDSVIIFSNTSHLNDDYPSVAKELKRQFDEAELKRLMDHQEATDKEKRKKVLVVFDDLLGDKSAKNSNLIMKCYSLGRHLSINPILICQVQNHVLTPTTKANSDYILMSRLNRFQLGNIWESIPHMDKNVFIKFVEDQNKNYQFIVSDMTSQSNNPADFLKVIKANVPKKLSKDADKDVLSQS